LTLAASSTTSTSTQGFVTTLSSASTRVKRGRQSGRVERLEPVVSGGLRLRSSKLAVPKCKAKARRLPSVPSIPNVTLPDAGAARFATVSVLTLRYYTDFVNFFCQWCRITGVGFDTDKTADRSLVQYFDSLIYDGAPNFEGRNTLHGFILLFPRSGKIDASRLPLSRKALRGWQRLMPGGSPFPQPLQLFFYLAQWLLDAGELEACIAVVLLCDSYARPSEIIDIDWCSVIRPANPVSSEHIAVAPSTRDFSAAWWLRREQKSWCLVFGDAALGRCTKTKKQDDTIIIGMPGREWVNDVLALYSFGRSGRLFPHLTLSKLEHLFRRGSTALGLRTFGLTPHKCRHAAPSHDSLFGVVDTKGIQERGRWASERTVSRYKQHGRYKIQCLKVTPELKKLADDATLRLPAKLSAAIRDYVPV
jgi:integrase